MTKREKGKFYIRIYRDKAGEWRARVTDYRHEVVLSSEGYVERASVVQLMRDLDVADFVFEEDD